MRAEIIVVGSELLLGQSVDTNGPWIANELSKIGVDCHFKTSVGDNLQNIMNTFNLALTRADIILCTGGLGPTQDDITKDAVSTLLNRPLIYDETLADVIREKFRKRHRTMSHNNLRQAYYPQNAHVLSEHPGTAPGLYINHNQQHIFLMPGVPTEMKLIFEKSILPIITSLLPKKEKIYTRTLRCWGTSESDIAELLNGINQELETQSNPKLSFLASGIEGIQVRFSSKNATEKEAFDLIKPYEDQAKKLLGRYLFGYDNDTIEVAVKKLLEEKKLSVSFYETFSSGLIAYRIQQLKGVHDFFKGSLVVNQPNDEKDIASVLSEINSFFNSDIALAVFASQQEKENIKLTLSLYCNHQLTTETVTLTHFNHKQSIEFSVINLLNFLRLFLLDQ